MIIGDRVVVTGVGLICALGDSPDDVFDRILRGESAARHWDDLEAEGFPTTTASRIDDRGELGTDPVRRGRALAVRAATAATSDAGLSGRDMADLAVYVGSTMGESAAFEAAARGEHANLDHAASDTFAAHVAERLETSGRRRTYGTACAAGNYAIGNAARAILAGRVDRAVAGGVDAFSKIAMLGFARARAMSSERCRPFDRNRRGMQLGEGAGFVVLERESAARRRGARVRGVVGALGLSGDAHHPTAPRPDGSGISRAMGVALRLQRLYPSDVGWLNAHGTGTPPSDAAEAAATSAVFGGHGVPVSSLKGAIGHCMGGASAIEAALTVIALERQTLPPNVGSDDVDEDLLLDVVRTPRPAPGIRWALNCGYAFGGLNSALLIGAA
jgi:3-oxoacyl-[acyl-carrier-protein] synthase II